MTPQALSALKEQREQLWSTIDAVLEENAKMRAELDRLRYAPVAVEVPDLLQCDWACSDSLRPVWEDGWRKAIASLPPHPDMVVVSREEGEIHGTPEDLAAIAEGAGWEWIRSPIGGKILVDYMADALRSQRTEEGDAK